MIRLRCTAGISLIQSRDSINTLVNGASVSHMARVYWRSCLVQTWLRKPFEWTPLRWIGLISYGLYMWHLLLLESFTKYVLTRIPDWSQAPHILVYAMYWGWLFVFIIPCVILLFAFVEKPWIQVSDRWTQKSKRVQANAVSP